MIADDDVTEAGEQTPADRLLALQALDTEADQLGLKRERLPERERVEGQRAAFADWDRRRTEMRQRIDALAAAMEDAEERSAALRADRARLEAQLKTIIAPREAEALMHEIETVGGRLTAVDDQELADLTESTTTEEALAEHLREEESLREGVARTEAALAAAVAEIDDVLAGIDEQRGGLRAALDPALLARYDRARSSLGVGVARLTGHRCDGCHLDLSAAEVDTAKDEAAATGITDCPQCGRMLVV